MGEAGRRREQYDADRAGHLLFPDNPGCAGTRHRDDGVRRPCMSEPVMTIAHRYEHPRRRTVRLLVCEAHAVGSPDPRPLTDHDRAELRRRRAVPRRGPGGGRRRSEAGPATGAVRAASSVIPPRTPPRDP